MRKISLLFVCIFSGSVFGQLTQDQRLLDFQGLVDLYAKRYAPYEWKRQALGIDLFNVAPWLAQVRGAKDDLEYYEIAAQYVAQLQDTHSRYRVPSSFVADLGIIVDIYDGKVLIEQINRTLLPQAKFPFSVGDEVISVDGKSIEDLIADFSRFRRWGSPLTTRRDSADRITFRPQSTLPRAVELGDNAIVVVQSASGDINTYTVPWTKTGFGLTTVGPVPGPFSATKSKALLANGVSNDVPEYLKLLNEMRTWSLPSDDPLFRGETTSEDTGEVLARRYTTGLGSRTPVFRNGLPANFVPRLGTTPTDFHFSGTYQSNGSKIGFLRIPNFSPNPAVAIRELETEIDFFQKNTDGLVVDVMRNPGGGCYMADLAAHLIPNNFFFFGEQIRPTLDRINVLQFSIELAKRFRADQWVIDVYQVYLDQVSQAYRENRGVTGSIPACTQTIAGLSPASSEQSPASIVYSKPLIILVDEFSISAADIFPAMMQDNHRGVIVGMRTSGGGGSISSWPAGFFSEATVSNTNSLVVRNHPIVTDEYPAAPYVENIGTRPDIKLDYMTKDNLVNNGRTFVDRFTAILLEEIEKSR